MLPEQTNTGHSNAEQSAPESVEAPESGAVSDPTPREAAQPNDPETATGVAASAEGEPALETGADASAGAPAGADGDKPKRKRKRRRKKKPHEPGAEAAPGEPAAAPPAGEASPGRSEQPRKTERREKKKRHRPPPDRAPFHAGEEVFGKVTSVLDHAIMIDLSGKALAIFDRSEMAPDDLVPTVGDRFVARVHQDGARGGLVVLTRKPLREEETKPRVEQAEKDGTLVQGLVTGVIKGGVEVDIGGLRAFAPASGMDLHPHNANFIQLLGQVLDFKVVQYDTAGRDVVVTRRPMLEAEAHERRKKALELLTEGQVLKGVVRTVVEWGIFVALPAAENLEGLVHVSEATHDPRAHLADLFHPGDEIDVKITKIDDKGKIWLSHKALVSDPWTDARQALPDGAKVSGKITRLEKFGVFVEVADGIEGLIHVSDLTMKRIEHPEELVKVGDPIEVVVHHFDLRNRKIALHPAPPPEQAGEQPQKVGRNAVVKVEVVRGESAGVVVRILGVTGRGARGFIPAGQTGTVRGTDLRKKFPAGMRLDVKVIDIDPRRGEPKLSIRQAAEDEERRAHREYRQQLAREGGFGTLGDLFASKLK